MAYDRELEDDAAALKARRAALRAFAEDITELVANLPMPETYLEAERGARAVTVADRLVVRLKEDALGGEENASEESPLRHPSPEAKFATSPVRFATGEEKMSLRMRLRGYADRLMEAAAGLDKPETYLESERALRYIQAADRMLGQLYEPPKPAKGSGHMFPMADEVDDGNYMDTGAPKPAYDDLEAWYAILESKLDRLAGRTAKDKGYWPHDGTPYSDDDPGYGLMSSLPPYETENRDAADSGLFGQRPCGCAISTPKCKGPCPLAP